MRFAIGCFASRPLTFSFVCAALLFASMRSTMAESAFIQQATMGAAGSSRHVTFNSMLQTSGLTVTGYRAPTHSGITLPTPETANPTTNHNFASTLEAGYFNRVTQVQSGSGNVSNVGIVKGLYNNVGVLQDGHSLTSNLLLVNTIGLSVGVLQPSGSAPVNMLIARLPNGALLIRR
jgi:hypothetical protein